MFFPLQKQAGPNASEMWCPRLGACSPRIRVHMKHSPHGRGSQLSPEQRRTPSTGHRWTGGRLSYMTFSCTAQAHTHTYTYSHAPMHMYTQCIYMQRHPHMHMCVHPYVHTLTCTHACTCIHVCAHVHAQSHTHTHTQNYLSWTLYEQSCASWT